MYGNLTGMIKELEGIKGVLTHNYGPIPLLMEVDTLKTLRTLVDSTLAFYEENGTDVEATNNAWMDEFMESANEPTPKKAPKKTYVYIMVDSHTGLYKIGHSKSPIEREKTLLSQAPAIELLFYFKATTQTELDLHKQFESKRGRGEWFSLNEADIENIKSNYLT